MLSATRRGPACREGAIRKKGDDSQRLQALWSDKTNTKRRGVDWHFTIKNARTKLKKLYLKIKV